jgi:hypothetical protein
MGFLRLGCAFVASLFVTAVFTILGGVFGAFIYSLVVSHSTTAPNLSSPGVYIGGVIGLLLGLIVMIAFMKRAANVNWLKSNGTRIIAIVVDIEKKWGSRQVPVGPNGQMQVQSFQYYVIVTQWIDPRTQQLYTFRSNNLNSYPRRISKGSSISVLIDPNNFGRYLVEV